MERRKHSGRTALLSVGFIAASVGASAQSSPPSQPTAANNTLSRSLGLFAYPRAGQPATQQVLDEGECFAWARTQTGIDPLAVPGAPAEPSAAAKVQEGDPAGSSGSKGAMAGAAGGAVAGTAIGAVAGDTGKGAAIGAGAGLLRRGRQARAAAKEQEKRAEAEAATRADAATRTQAGSRQQRETFGRAFGACLEGRGYTVK